MRQMGVLEARTEFSRIVAEVERTGEEVTVTRHGKAAVKIVPVNSVASRKRSSDEWQRNVKRILKARASQVPIPNFDDLSWESLKGIGRGENRHD